MPYRAARFTLRATIAALYICAGVLHIASPNTFLPITPDWAPHKTSVIVFTGFCELLGAVGLLNARSRKYAGLALAAYAICVFPANLNHAFTHPNAADTRLMVVSWPPPFTSARIGVGDAVQRRINKLAVSHFRAR